MELALFLAVFAFFLLGFPAPELLVRLSLTACRRFSPRASLALSGLCALCGACCALALRGGLRAVPAPGRRLLVPAACLGGALGRALLLAFCARFPASQALSRLHAAPLLLLCLLALLPERAAVRPPPPRPAAFRAACFFCAVTDGFFGAGGALLFSGLWPRRIARRRFASPALPLLLSVCAQGSALLTAAMLHRAQVFPPAMAGAVALGAALGAAACEREKERGPLEKSAAAALKVYLVLCALSNVEQALEG